MFHFAFGHGNHHLQRRDAHVVECIGGGGAFWYVARAEDGKLTAASVDAVDHSQWISVYGFPFREDAIDESFVAQALLFGEF